MNPYYRNYEQYVLIIFAIIFFMILCSFSIGLFIWQNKQIAILKQENKQLQSDLGVLKQNASMFNKNPDSVAAARNVERRNGINQTLNAISQYASDNYGQYPSNIQLISRVISKSTIDICSALVPTYIAALPVDPLRGKPISSCDSLYYTGYDIYKDQQERITITAPAAELGETISVTR